MNGTMSTTKEKEVIWEEIDSTPPPKKSATPSTNGVCDTTIAIRNLSENVPSTDTTRISGIYKIVNKVNGKYYVGGSKNIHKRWLEHKGLLRRNIHDNGHLQNAWNKYGEATFDFIVECISSPPRVVDRRTKIS